MSEEDLDASAEVLALAKEILGDVVDLEGTGVDRDVWDALSSSGLTEITSSNEGGWSELAALLGQVGAHAARVPVAEHDVLAGWLLRTAGLPPASGMATAGVSVDGVGHNVPWGREADLVVLVGRDHDRLVRVWSVAPVEAKVIPGENLAGDARDTVHVPADAVGGVVEGDVLEEFRLRLALSRALQIAGAAGTVLDLTVGYSREREQFGRPISRFQAVQDLVSGMAAEAALVSVAADEAVARLRYRSWADPSTRVAVLGAASCAGHAASRIARSSHQVLGAMGCTREHRLHRFTNRMLAWSSDAGPLQATDAELLSTVRGLSREDLWALLVDTARRDPRSTSTTEEDQCPTN